MSSSQQPESCRLRPFLKKPEPARLRLGRFLEVNGVVAADGPGVVVVEGHAEDAVEEKPESVESRENVGKSGDWRPKSELVTEMVGGEMVVAVEVVAAAAVVVAAVVGELAPGHLPPAFLPLVMLPMLTLMRKAVVACFTAS